MNNKEFIAGLAERTGLSQALLTCCVRTIQLLCQDWAHLT